MCARTIVLEVEMQQVRVGVVLPSRETIMAGRRDGTLLLEAAEAAERLGFDSVWVGDSLFHRPRFEPLAALAAVAARTSRVEVGTAILIPALRSPMLVAQALASVDAIAQGRVIAGVGAGWIPMEFEAVGVPFDQRLGRLMETVRLCRTLWSETPPQDRLRSKYWDLPAVDLKPKPYRAGGLPFWIGGSGPRALGYAGAHFDGWIPTPPTPEAFRDNWARVCDAATAAGRTPDDIASAAYLTLNIADDAAKAEAESAEYAQGYYGMPIEIMRKAQSYDCGNAEHCAESLQRFVDAGARHLVLRFASLDVLEQMERAAATVVPAIHAANG